MPRRFFLLVGLVFALTRLALGQNRGVIDDPDGFTNLRAERSADSAIVARVKNGEVFKFEVPRFARRRADFESVRRKGLPKTLFPENRRHPLPLSDSAFFGLFG